MKKLCYLFLVLLLLVCMLSVLPVNGEEAVFDGVIRLHILANSDNPEDQANKLAVRDAVLKAYGDALAGYPTREAAAEELSYLLPEMEALAKKTLEGLGDGSPVAVTLTEETYPRRDYGTFALPAGEYLSLRILIGEAAGENWWCVLYPPLCLGTATDTPVGMEDATYGLLTENGGGSYTVKFRLLELLETYFG